MDDFFDVENQDDVALGLADAFDHAAPEIIKGQGHTFDIRSNGASQKAGALLSRATPAVYPFRNL